ncbi:unnamed protein product [Aspergillus oryzae]|nr:unnamed protein product [Aspergillus oryzae]
MSSQSSSSKKTPVKNTPPAETDSESETTVKEQLKQIKNIITQLVNNAKEKNQEIENLKVQLGEAERIRSKQQDHIAQLNAQVRASVPKDAIGKVKLPKAEPFNGTRSKLQAFLTQMNMHIHANRKNLIDKADKVIFISTHLQLFTDSGNLRKHLERTFGDVDAEAIAERKLKQLYQRGSASTYAAEFQQIISRMDWNEKVYVSTFISGLKGHVKDEFARIDRPATLNEAIDFAVKVDNRYHERLMEKRDNEAWRKGSHRPKGQYKSNDQRERTGAKHNDPYGLKPMELDATEGQGQSRGISQKERERRKREKLCYNCGKAGHMSKDCRQKRNSHQPNRKPQQINATENEAEPPRKARFAQLNANAEADKPHDQARGAYCTTGIKSPIMDEIGEGIEAIQLNANMDLSARETERYRENEPNDDDWITLDWLTTHTNQTIWPRINQDWSNLQDATEQWYGQLNEHEIDELADHANNETDRLGRVNSESQYEATMEPIRERVRHALTHRVDGPDNTDQYNEPVSSIDQSNRVLIEIDPLNEEYGTQWIGHDPNMEELLEVPETPENPQDEDENAHRRVMALIDTLQEVVSPRRRTPVSRLYRTQQIEVEPPRRQETLTNWTNNVINEIMRNPMRFSRPLRMLLEQCLHWNHECWDSNIENWDEHCQQCDKHPIIEGRQKENVEPLLGLDGQKLGTGQVSVETVPVTMAVGQHVESIAFDVTPLGNKYDVVLGISWLEDHNPTIDWRQRTLHLNNCHCPKGPRTGYGTRTLTSKCTGSGRIERRDQDTAKGNSAKNIIMAATRYSEKEWLAELMGWAPTNEQERLEVMTLESESEEEWHSSPETNQTSSELDSDSWILLDSQELAANSAEQPSLPKEYQGFRELFEQPRTNKLLEHGPHDHTIPI